MISAEVQHAQYRRTACSCTDAAATVRIVSFCRATAMSLQQNLQLWHGASDSQSCSDMLVVHSSRFLVKFGMVGIYDDATCLLLLLPPHPLTATAQLCCCCPAAAADAGCRQGSRVRHTC